MADVWLCFIFGLFDGIKKPPGFYREVLFLQQNNFLRKRFFGYFYKPVKGSAT